MNEIAQYRELLTDIKNRVRKGQLRVNLSANAEMLNTYWDVGRMIRERQQNEGWGSSVIPRLASDLKNELSEVKGFSERNLKFMVQFYNEYSSIIAIGKPPVSQLKNSSEAILQLPVAKLEKSDFKQDLILSTTWSNHIILIQKVKDLPTRYWYMQSTGEQFD
ncbi:MAG: DUF1016 N-terminal domain-containing protein [Candidatus Delongbacteria bacterium]|nr:DUF1016 N-terminal domain-containing protein [Candidatus Delongbacteria bacterium]